MHRPKTADSATAEGRFTAGDPLAGVPATRITYDWLNDLLDNLEEVCTQGGVTFTQGRRKDLADAIGKLIAQKLDDTNTDQTIINNIINKLIDELRGKIGGEALLDRLVIDGPATGTFTVPAGVARLEVEAWGGGGGGGGQSTADASRAGGGGGYVRASLAVTPGQTYPYEIGAGGAGSIVDGVGGSDGGRTAIAGLVALGGRGGGPDGTVGGGSGSGGGCDLSAAPSSAHCETIFGGAGDDLFTDVIAGSGGDAPRGGGGGGLSAGDALSGAGKNNGRLPGGGGGACAARAGNPPAAGKGGAGRLILSLYSAVPAGSTGGTTPPVVTGLGATFPNHIETFFWPSQDLNTTWVVPTGVTSIIIDACGGQANDDCSTFARDAMHTVRARRTVTPGQTLTVTIGRIYPDDARFYRACCAGIDSSYPGFLRPEAVPDAVLIDVFPFPAPFRRLVPGASSYETLTVPSLRILY